MVAVQRFTPARPVKKSGAKEKSRPQAEDETRNTTTAVSRTKEKDVSSSSTTGPQNSEASTAPANKQKTKSKVRINPLFAAAYRRKEEPEVVVANDGATTSCDGVAGGEATTTATTATNNATRTSAIAATTVIDPASWLASLSGGGGLKTQERTKDLEVGQRGHQVDDERGPGKQERIISASSSRSSTEPLQRPPCDGTTSTTRPPTSELVGRFLATLDPLDPIEGENGSAGIKRFSKPFWRTSSLDEVYQSWERQRAFRNHNLKKKCANAKRLAAKKSSGLAYNR
ncbi:unnamed protein product [Amoebophrya sp. A25]|nr:unnamed protein product [Amoebophrya sp. A25]|eukprot:GSA25T00019787001.1